ncbi:MAG TPA: BamA/TamA family outer membrane protein, partial [Longimicrobiales bacterium]|nr:BamA/TamA family outer membrane protein [Longimicrobiales bacterium]
STISTQATRCRVFFLKPLCILTRNHLFEFRHKLDREELGKDLLRVKVFYWLRGFRHAQVDTTVTPKGRGVAVTFNVTEGPPTLIQTLSVRQTRELLSMRTLHRFGLPNEGDRIDLTRLDTLHVRARRALWDRGYGNAVVSDTAQLVDSLRVALDVLVDVGAITTVDTVIVNGNEHVSARTVSRLIGMKRGSLYKRGELLEAQRRLYRSDLFRQTVIEVPDSADTAKTVIVTVREAPLRAWQLGGGVNTIDFGQLQANLTLFNFHGSARRVELNSAIGNLGAPALYGKSVFGSAAPLGTDGDPDPAFLRPTWQLSASVTQPWVFSSRNSLGLTVFANRRSIPNIVIDRGTGASATFTRTLSPGLPLSFTYRYERSRVEAGELYFCVNFGYCRLPTIDALQQSQSMSPFIVSLRADRTDDPLEPTTGYTARLDLEHASALTASEWRFNRFELDVTPYLKVGRRTLVLRLHGGRVTGLSGTNDALGITGSDAELMHPRTRFYGGGARSVRGFAQGQLGPRVLTIDPAELTSPDDTSGAAPCTNASIIDGSCDPNVANSSDFVPRPVGGNSLIEGTIEYRFPLSRKLGGAVFVDAGRVGGSNLGELLRAKSAVTPGIGFRYSSPVGPVRIDLALRPSSIEELPVVTQFRDANGDLRLVELDTPKRFDPTAGSRGFLGKLTSRLQLHLYIGEAY